MTTFLRKKLMVIGLSVCIIFIGFTAYAAAATYYVSPSGNTLWQNCQDVGQPCSPSTAMSNAVAGDVVYFRGGTYTAGDSADYHGYYEPSNSGSSGNPITFIAYPNETPIFNVVIAGDCEYALGNDGKSYIIFDGFKIQANSGVKMGGIIIHYGTNCEIKNCEFDGGSTIITSTDNRETLRIEQTSNLLVSQCTFYNVNQISDWHNTSALKMYYSDGVTIENCEIYNAAAAVFIKRDVQNVIVKNNFIHDVNLPIYQANNGVSSSNISIYNNVIVNFDKSGYAASEDNSYSDSVKIYNNTVVNGTYGVGICANNTGNGAEVYNNIFYGITNQSIGTTRNYANLKTSDHNSFYSSFMIKMYIYGTSAATYTSLLDWQSSGALEGGGNSGSGSLISDPKFVNSSSQLNQLNDFLLADNSPLKSAGRNGVDMGANIALVGPNSGKEMERPNRPADFTHE